MTSKLRISVLSLFANVANDEYSEFNSFVYNTVNVLRLLRGDLKILSYLCLKIVGLQRFDAVGWVSGRASRKNLADEVLAWLSSGVKCK